MAGAGTAHMQPTVNVTEFCGRASKLFVERTKRRFVVEQMISALGGISNLYVHVSMEKGEDSFTLDTELAFASSLVPEHAILAQIERCTGVPGRYSRAVLDCLRETLRGYFTRPNTRVVLPCLGVFHPLNLEQDRYSVEFRNPIQTHF
jgi:hypothetical protein